MRDPDDPYGDDFEALERDEMLVREEFPPLLEMNLAATILLAVLTVILLTVLFALLM